MNEPETLPPGIHPEAALLPWYANGTLPATEREQMAQHLKSCAACRAELDEIASLQTRLKPCYESRSGPSPDVVRSVLGTVTREAVARQEKQPPQSFWLGRIDQWFRSWFLLQWTPTLAAALLVAQLGLLVWVGVSPTPQGQIVTRSLGMQSAKIAIAFQTSATDEQIRTLLQSVRGRVIDGPTTAGLYTIEVLSADTSIAEKKRALLQARADVVRSAELVRP
jgi:anti-sigma factor RsiW